MYILNFSHPITVEQEQQIEAITGESIERVVDVPTHFDQNCSFWQQTQEIIDGIDLTPEEWYQKVRLVNLPSLSSIAALVVVELLGRIGTFSVMRLRPVEDSPLVRYEVAEIMNLQSIRDQARARR